MVLSKRERSILLSTAAAVVLLMLNWIVVDPLWAERGTLADEIDAAQLKLARDQGLVANMPAMNRRWREMVSGAVKDNVSEAESQLYRAIDDWAQSSGFNVATTNRERASEKEKDFLRMTVRITGTGGMSQVARFLHHAQMATIPVRVTEVTITPKREATDELTVNLALSTIYLPPDPNKTAGGAAPREARP